MTNIATRSANRLALELYRRLALGNTTDNFAFCPMVVFALLAMVRAGARGQTAWELSEFLRVENDDEFDQAVGRFVEMLSMQTEGCEVTLAQSLWLQRGRDLLADFRLLVENIYRATVGSLDFLHDREEACRTVNEWVARETADKIREVVRPEAISLPTSIVLASAVDFRGVWKWQFDPRHTREEDFHLAGGGSVRADLMYLQGGSRPLSFTREFMTLELPYVGDLVSMLVLLPRETDSLVGSKPVLSVRSLERAVSMITHLPVAEVVLPRFSLSWDADLTDTLRGMGMPTAFGPDADFSRMTNERGLFISFFTHKTVVEVSEAGTTAAAAAAAGLAKCRPIVFRADRPFLFVIRHRSTGVILFMGRVMNPAV